MNKSVRYLERLTNQEKWDVLKRSDVKAVMPVIESLEYLSEHSTLDNIDVFKQVEQRHLTEISELDVDDRHVLEETINRVLFQSYRVNTSNYTRWMFTLERAKDMKVLDEMAKVNSVVVKAQEIMDTFASETDAESYLESLAKVLYDLDVVWTSVSKEINHLSPCWQTFFEVNVDRKRLAIQRHKRHFTENTFGKWLESIRREREWSLAKAEKKTGVSASYIHRMENGRRGVPSFGKLRELASGYDIPFDRVVAMVTDGVKEVEGFIEDGIFKINNEDVSPKVQYDIAEMLHSLKTDDMVSAHEKLDEIARQIHN